MKTLSGVLEFSMGNFLCLRGYMDYKTLSAISEENKAVQRELIDKHKGEMVSFLNSGEYRFFPEIVLSQTTIIPRLVISFLKFPQKRSGIKSLVILSYQYIITKRETRTELLI